MSNENDRTEQRPRRIEDKDIETEQGIKSLTSMYCPKHNISYPKGETCPLCQ